MFCYSLGKINRVKKRFSFLFQKLDTFTYISFNEFKDANSSSVTFHFKAR